MHRSIDRSIHLLLKRDIKDHHSVAAKEVEINGLFKALGTGRNVLVFELDLAVAALVVLGTNVVVKDVQGQDHVVEGVDIKGKGLVPDGVSFARLGRRDLRPVVLVAELENI